MNKSKSSCGFTLIELMIAVAIVGILAAIAYPAYTEQVRKSHRSEAKGRVLELAQLLERRYTSDNAYNIDNSGNSVGPNGGGYLSQILGSAALRNVPSGSNSASRRYRIDLNNLTATTFRLQAVRFNSQAADRCGTLRLDETGRKTCPGSGYNAAECRQQCW